MERLSREGVVGRQPPTLHGVAVHINATTSRSGGCWRNGTQYRGGHACRHQAGNGNCLPDPGGGNGHDDLGALPEGAIQPICGSTGDLLEHLHEQDVVTFTGLRNRPESAQPPEPACHQIPFTMKRFPEPCHPRAVGTAR